jgi:hypothetical protein
VKQLAFVLKPDVNGQFLMKLAVVWTVHMYICRKICTGQKFQFNLKSNLARVNSRYVYT